VQREKQASSSLPLLHASACIPPVNLANAAIDVIITDLLALNAIVTLSNSTAHANAGAPAAHAELGRNASIGPASILPAPQRSARLPAEPEEVLKYFNIAHNATSILCHYSHASVFLMEFMMIE
jgi:hypothetical protein